MTSIKAHFADNSPARKQSARSKSQASKRNRRKKNVFNNSQLMTIPEDDFCIFANHPTAADNLTISAITAASSKKMARLVFKLVSVLAATMVLFFIVVPTQLGRNALLVSSGITAGAVPSSLLAAVAAVPSALAGTAFGAVHKALKTAAPLVGVAVVLHSWATAALTMALKVPSSLLAAMIAVPSALAGAAFGAVRKALWV